MLVFNIIILYLFKWEFKVLLKFDFNFFFFVIVFLIVFLVAVILKDFWVCGVIILVIKFCRVFCFFLIFIISSGFKWKLMVKLVDNCCKFFVEFCLGILNFCIVILYILILEIRGGLKWIFFSKVLFLVLFKIFRILVWLGLIIIKELKLISNIKDNIIVNINVCKFCCWFFNLFILKFEIIIY